MDKPQPFIESSPDGKLSINKAALKYLQSESDKPLDVIAIVGKYRTGKSYLLNRFFDVHQGFALGSTIQSKTKGIWIWARPHPKDPTKTLVLLDTEGLFDVEKGNQQHDTTLFCLVLLLCNCLVYNAVGTLDDLLMQQLHFVTELTEHIKVKDGSSDDEDGTQFGQFFPSLCFVLRDFFLELELNGKPCTPDDYMENALRLKPGHGPKVTAYNEPRECIRQYFPTRRCFTLCKPVDNDEKLRKLDAITDVKEIKPEFIKATNECIEAILRDVKPITIQGHRVNGDRFFQLAHAYVQQMNNGAVPCIASTVTLLKNNECQKALENAIKRFTAEMERRIPKLPVAVDVLTSAQQEAHKCALESYNRESLFDEEGTYLRKLAEQLQETFNGIMQRNFEESHKVCRELLCQCYVEIEKNLNNGVYTDKGGYKKYCDDREKALKKYHDQRNKGPAADKVLNEFMDAKGAEMNAILLADKALEEKEKQLAIKNEETRRAQERERALEQEKKILHADLLRQAQDQANIVNELQREFAANRDQLEMEKRKEMEAMQKEYQKLIADGMTKQAEQMQTLLASMQEDKKKMEERFQQQNEQLLESQRQHEDVMVELREQRKLTQQQLENSQAQLRELQNQKKGTFLDGLLSVVLPMAKIFIPGPKP